MPITFTCPHCNAQTLVADCYLGVTGPCATCGKLITVIQEQQPAAARQRRPRNVGVTNRAVRLVLAGMCVAALMGSLFLWAFLTLVWPELQRVERLSVKENTRENLELIGTALRAYHNDHGCFPPAVLYDDGGRPLHSWRVLILPYLGEDELYRAYRFDEPWNGPNNLMLASDIPLAYQDHSDRDAREAGETLFLAICGEGSAFPRHDQVGLNEILDGMGDTALVAESAGCKVSWLEPADLQITRMSFNVNDVMEGNAIVTNQGDGPLVLLADGTVKELRTDASPAQIRGLVTIDGGERIHWNAISK